MPSHIIHTWAEHKAHATTPTQESEFDMTKGVRDFVNEKFGELLPLRAEMGNTEFRRAVMQAAMAQYGISLASAATHYNHSLKTVRGIDGELVEGLGRPEGKKGGRKVVKAVTVIKAKSGEVVAAGISRAKANELLIAAAGKGKTKLAIKEDAEAEAVPELTATVVDTAPAVETATA